jgi:hypothetical protein
MLEFSGRFPKPSFTKLAYDLTLNIILCCVHAKVTYTVTCWSRPILGVDELYEFELWYTSSSVYEELKYLICVANGTSVSLGELRESPLQ